MHIYVSLNTGYYLVIGLTGGSKKLRFTQITQFHALNSFPLHAKQVQVSNQVTKDIPTGSHSV